MQLNFFNIIDEPYRIADIQRQKKMWQLCWNWNGPEIDKPLEICSITSIEYETGERIYHYGARCIAEKEVSPDNWLVRIEYLSFAPESCIKQNGKKLLLNVIEIWPPTGDIKRERRDHAKED